MQRRPDFTFPGSPARGAARARPVEDNEEEEVRWLQASRQGSPDVSSYHYSSSGTPSPQLWTQQQQRDHHHQHRRPGPASAGSSPSRAQAIAGYRREMLDLVRGLPESAYELSLRDIVERPSSPPSSAPLPVPAPRRPPTPPPAPPSNSTATVARDREVRDAPANASAADEQAAAKQSKKGRRAVRRQRSRSLERSVSLDTGLLIKFFTPLSIGGRKKVSPRPDAAAKDANKKNKDKQGAKKKKKEEEEARQKQKQDEEWWSKSEFSEDSGAGSSSRTSSKGSSNSNSSSAGSVRSGGGGGGNSIPRAPVRSRSRKRNGCYAFFRVHKSKNGINQD